MGQLAFRFSPETPEKHAELMCIKQQLFSCWILRGSKKIVVGVLSSLNNKRAHLDEILPCGRQWLVPLAYEWSHNGRDGISNQQLHDCLLNHSFRRRSKKTSQLRVTGLCAGNSQVTGEFPSQRPVTWKMIPFVHYQGCWIVLTHCSLVTSYGIMKLNLVDIGSGNGLLPGSTKPLPAPMSTNHQSGPVAFIWGQFYSEWASD